MRGRLVFAFLAELHRLDTAAMAAVDPGGTGPLTSGYDADFHEPSLIDSDDDGVAEPWRRELPPVRVPCQVEPAAFEALRMTPAGNAPRTSIDLVFHFRDLERLDLVDPTTGDARIRPSDRLGGIYGQHGTLVQAVRTPLFVTESKPFGFGIGRRRNLLLVSFEDRPTARLS